jgi:DNA-binding NarL/FixJ family response regulator
MERTRPTRGFAAPPYEHPPDLALAGAGPAREAETVRVLIAHGDSLARTGLQALLEVDPGIAVAGSAADGDEAVAVAAQVRPDVLLVDLALPGTAAVEVARMVLGDPDISGIRVLILSASEQGEAVLSALRAGASGFLLTDTEPADLVDAVRAVAAGEAALSASVLSQVVAELASQPDPRLPGPEGLEELTAREREVMSLVAAGMSNDEIAEHLVVSPATAKAHVSRAMVKLHARHRAQLVTLAYETGLVLPKNAAAARSDVAPATVPA